MTLKPLEDEVRQWELFENEGIDFTDSFALPVRLAGRENRVFFIEPCDPELPWITDRGRLFFEGAFHEVRSSTEVVKEDILFSSLLSLMFFLSHLNLRTSALNYNRCVILFKRLSLEILFSLNLFRTKFSFFTVKSESPFFTNTDFESSSQLTPSYRLKLKLSGAVVLVGLNTRFESFVLNLALRQKKLKGRFEIFCLAPYFNLTVPSKLVGSSFKPFVSLVEGCHAACQKLTKVDLPMVFTNSSFFRNPSMSRLVDMVSVVTLASSSMGGGLSVVAESLETNATRYSAKFEQIDTKDFETSKVVFHLNSDFSESSEIRAQINIGVLGVSGHPGLKVQTVIEQSNEKDKNRDLTMVSARGMLVHRPYLHLPTKNPFEEQTTHFNSEGLVKRSFIVANSTRSFFSDSYENLRRVYSAANQVSFLFNSKDNDRVSNLLATSDNHKSYLWFMFMATASIVSMSARLDSDSTAFGEERFSACSDKFKQFDRSFKNFKIKYKFDDFFTGGSKDMLSTKSTTLIKCSKSVRLKTSNFF